MELKAKANNKKWIEIMGKQNNDPYHYISSNNGKVMSSILDTLFKNAISKPQEMDAAAVTTAEISSFQALCALL